MKKILLSLFTVAVASLLFLPTIVMAEEDTIKGNATSIQEACAEENIAFDHSDYKNNEEGKVNLYLFRGQGCSHCHEFLEYLESIIDEYGKYINVITYEVWNDTENSSLMEKVASKLGEEASGVPFIIIGEKTFPGYSSSMNEEIQNTIKEEYEKEEKYDVMKELGVDTSVSNKKVDNKASSGISTSDIIVIVVAIIIIGGIVLLVVTARKEN